MSLTAAGLLAAVAAAACYESGYVLQALEARAAPAGRSLRGALLIGLAARPRWLAGTALSLVGAALQVLALALAPVTLVQPLLGLGLVALLWLARSALGERLSAFDLVGAGLVLAGIVAVGVAGPERTGTVGSVTALTLIAAPLAALTLLPYALRARAPLRLAAVGAATGDALAAIALKLAADALAGGRPGLAALAAAGAGAAGWLALGAEMSALRRLPASRVAPVVLAAQVSVPALAALAAFGERTGPVLLLGVAAAGAGASLLGASGAIAGLRGGCAEAEAVAYDRGRRRQLREGTVR